ncbi:MAG: type II toxin-antitoxin system VapC family toxin [Thermofilaceae archaeon]
MKRGEVKVFLKGSSLDLAIYEATNAVWKECYLLRKIGEETAYKLIGLLSKVFNVLDLYTVRGFEREVVNIAVKEGITVYDAAYIYIAAQNKLVLVTDDKKLMNTAKKYVNTATTIEIVT